MLTANKFCCCRIIVTTVTNSYYSREEKTVCTHFFVKEEKHTTTTEFKEPVQITHGGWWKKTWLDLGMCGGLAHVLLLSSLISNQCTTKDLIQQYLSDLNWANVCTSEYDCFLCFCRLHMGCKKWQQYPDWHKCCQCINTSWSTSQPAEQIYPGFIRCMTLLG